jgi:PPIC-type PPIASE domain
MFKRLLREPLAHFLVIGLLLFLVFRVIGGDRSASGREIVVNEQVVGTLVQQFSGVWQRPPSKKELQGLIDGWVREEVLYREGVQLGLDRDDPVIRRRVRQKVDVLAEESQPSQAPTNAELAQWLQANAARYALAPVLSFEQAMIDPSRHANDLKKATDDVQRKLQRGVDPADATESHLLPARIADTPEDLVARDFGEEFITALRALPLGSWQGPVHSGFGLHFVKITSRVAGRAPSLDEVRAEVSRDVEQDRRERAAKAFYDKARRNYKVRIEAGPGSAGAGK